MAKSLSVLGMWKMAMADEISPQLAEHFREKMKHPALDWSDPNSYQIVASAWEEEIEDDDRGEPPEVTARLLPYRLLNRLQMEWDRMTGELVDEILDNAAACAPVFPWCAVAMGPDRGDSRRRHAPPGFRPGR